MTDELIERRKEAKEFGKMQADLEHIKNDVKKLAKTVEQGFGSLKCGENTAILTKLDTKYKADEQIKQHIVKTVITKTLSAGGLIAAGATAVYAYFK